eukprot:CAMPEP_0116885264 /NCGR_PEP_ID=MMETSP0463-20121206/18553_1 /TAXON_ID=181622 /ORGANISM="Strombidinopsis sp, Strain SopsisLIS2011" /LENGTH=120 /DNA_ID=CAMNT_0004543389 /DNA_START=279 /DNA_END=641 /DNA_ORIENTATION=+
MSQLKVANETDVTERFYTSGNDSDSGSGSGNESESQGGSRRESNSEHNDEENYMGPTSTIGRRFVMIRWGTVDYEETKTQSHNQIVPESIQTEGRLNNQSISTLNEVSLDNLNMSNEHQN